MSFDPQQRAYEFRAVFGQPIFSDSPDIIALQRNLIKEEACEFLAHGMSNEDTLKELADLVFVCYQYATARGWNLNEALERVFESNMSKLVDGKVLRREDGKVLKGPNYQPPDLSDLV